MSSKLEIENVKDIYEKIALEFQITRTYNWDWIDSFINNLPSNCLIYDIGCGSGRNMKYKNYKFIGFDNCEKFLQICKNQSLQVIYSEITNLHAQDNSCDAIICIATFHHLSEKENRIKALNELYRVLKNQGKLLLSVWSFDQPKKTRVTFSKYGDNIVYWKNKYPRYYYIFKLEEIIDLINNSLFELKEYKYNCGNNIFILKKEMKKANINFEES